MDMWEINGHLLDVPDLEDSEYLFQKCREVSIAVLNNKRECDSSFWVFWHWNGAECFSLDIASRVSGRNWYLKIKKVKLSDMKLFLQKK